MADVGRVSRVKRYGLRHCISGPCGQRDQRLIAQQIECNRYSFLVSLGRFFRSQYISFLARKGPSMRSLLRWTFLFNAFASVIRQKILRAEVTFNQDGDAPHIPRRYGPVARVLLEGIDTPELSQRHIPIYQRVIRAGGRTPNENLGDNGSMRNDELRIATCFPIQSRTEAGKEKVKARNSTSHHVPLNR